MNRQFVGLPLPEFLILLAFVFIAAVAVCFHEPWSDEAQAWLIARDLGIGGIFHQMGYEGSPPLWHLLLWLLIRLHLPYSALGAVSLTPVAAAMYVWLRWSPFPAPVRWLLPFAFYYQYQYAVVARSYALSTLLAFAAVALWRSNPVRAIPLGLVLALLAQSNMHGFMIAGGISCAIAWQIITEYRKQRSSPKRILPAGIAAVLVLASVAIARYLAKPYPDCSFKAAIQLRKETALGSLVRALGGISTLSTALGLNMSWGLGLLFIFTLGMIAVKKRALVLPTIIASAMVAYLIVAGATASFPLGSNVVLLILLLAWFVAIKQPAWALPFVFTVLAMGLIWSRPWHYGMALTALLVSLWGAWPDGRLSALQLPSRILAISLAVLLLLQLPLTAESVRDDAQGPYSGAEATAEFLRPYVGKRPIYCINFYGTGVQPYFGRNIFVNWPTAYWTWSNRMAYEAKRVLNEYPPDNAIVVVPSGGQRTPKADIPKSERAQLAKRNFFRRREFCGAQFWLGRVSEYECYEIYMRQAR